MKCAVCKKKLGKGKLRYIVKINTYAAYDTLEITPDDLLQDYNKIMKKLLTSLEKKSKKLLEEEIYRNFKFDMCKTCRNIFIKNPLGLKKKT
jgi:hypothetical protein